MNWEQIRTNWKPITVIFLTTLILVIGHYRNYFDTFQEDMLFFYLLIPLFVIVVIFRESPAEYRLGWGDWKAGLVFTAVGIAGITLVMPLVALNSGFHSYYSSQAKDFLPLVTEEALKLISWEFFFRGFLLFSLARIAGPHAIWLQAVPFTMAHFGKPEIEVLSCMFGGSAFGYVAWRTNSVIYPFLLHTYLSVLTIMLCG